jgi:putative ABC transport system permease protein
MDDEMRFHLELAEEDNLGRGMNAEQARRAARRTFGGMEQVKEASRDVRRLRWVEDAWQDLSYGARMLVRNRIFTAVSIVTLAFGIGANTAIFSVVYAVLLSPLPYPQPERIVVVVARSKEHGAQRLLSGPEFIELGRQNRVLDQWSTFEAREFVLTGREGPEQVKGLRIAADLLSLFGVTPNPGRAFSVEEFQPGHDQVVLISHRLWQRRWAADPQIIGQALTLQQKSCTVIGIIPPPSISSPTRMCMSRQFSTPSC